MRRISTLFEVILSATLLILGIYMLHEGGSSKSVSGAAILIGGAVCFTLGVMTLVPATRSILWHRHMLRNSISNQQVDGAAREQNNG